LLSSPLNSAISTVGAATEKEILNIMKEDGKKLQEGLLMRSMRLYDKILFFMFPFISNLFQENLSKPIMTYVFGN
jgi:hypothetical protein